MMMVVVVPIEECPAERPRVVDRVEPVGEAGPVLERLELRLRVGVVGRGVGPAVRLQDAEVGEQEGDRLGGHRGAAVGMQRELARLNVVLRAGFGDEALGERRARRSRDPRRP